MRHRKASAVVISITILAVVCAGLFVGCSKKSPVAALTAAGSAVELVPADTMLCVVINDIDAASKNIDEFMLGLSLVPVSASMGVKMGLISAVGEKHAPGIDTSGDIAVFAFKMDAQPSDKPNPLQGIGVAAIVPLADFDLLTKDNPAIQGPDAGGIYRLTAMGQKIAFKPLGSYAVMAGEFAGFDAAQIIQSVEGSETSIAAGMDAHVLEDSGTYPVWAYFDIQALNKNYGPMFSGYLQMGRGAMAKQLENVPEKEAASSRLGMKFLNSYFDLIDMFLNQGKSFCLSLDVRPDMLKFKKTFFALPGTAMAAYFAEDDRLLNTALSKYATEDSFVTLAMKVDTHSYKELTSLAVAWAADILSGGEADELVEKAQKSMTDMLDAMGGDYMYSINFDEAGSIFAGNYVLEVKDEQKYSAAVDAAVEFWTSPELLKFTEDLGFKLDFVIDKNALEIEGRPVDKARLNVSLVDEESKESDALKKIFGEGLDYYWTISEKLWLCSVGGEGKERLGEMLKDTQTPAAQAFLDSISMVDDWQKADMAGTYNYAKALVWSMQIADILGETAVDTSKFSCQSQISFAAKFLDNGAKFEAVVPKAHVKEITEIFMGIQAAQKKPANQPAPQQQQ
jgi:hypothetical protein